MLDKRILRIISRKVNDYLDLYDEEYLDIDLIVATYNNVMGAIGLALNLTRRSKTRTQLLSYMKQLHQHYLDKVLLQ